MQLLIINWLLQVLFGYHKLQINPFFVSQLRKGGGGRELVKPYNQKLIRMGHVG